MREKYLASYMVEDSLEMANKYYNKVLTEVIPLNMYKDNNRHHRRSVHAIGKKCVTTFSFSTWSCGNLYFVNLWEKYKIIIHDVCSKEFITYMEKHLTDINDVRGITIIRHSRIPISIYIPIDDFYQIVMNNEYTDSLKGEVR